MDQVLYSSKRIVPATDMHFAVPDVPVISTLLLHNNGIQGSTLFIDSAGRHTVTGHGATLPIIDTTQSVFGGASALFNGVDQYLAVNDNASEFAFGVGNFTIDFRLRVTTTAVDQSIIGDRPAATNGGYFTILLNTGGTLRFISNGSARILAAGSIAINTWYHIAFCRYGTGLFCFQDGIQQGSVGNDPVSYVAPPVDRPVIGILDFDAVSTPLSGWIDELRVVPNVAVWTSNFTPPTAQYTR